MFSQMGIPQKLFDSDVDGVKMTLKFSIPSVAPAVSEKSR